MYTFGIILLCALFIALLAMVFHWGYSTCEIEYLEENQETPKSTKILQYPERVVCATCGCVYQYGLGDVQRKGWPTYSVYVECPICRGKHFID